MMIPVVGQFVLEKDKLWLQNLVGMMIPDLADTETSMLSQMQFGCDPMLRIAQSTGAVEYTDCFSAEGLTPDECSRYLTKQSNAEVPVMLELWEMQNTPLLPSHPCPHWPGVMAPDRVQSMAQIELNCILMLNWIGWNRIVLTFNWV